MIVFLIALLWLALGARACYLAHTGLQSGCVDECGPGVYPLGGMWVIWAPFLIGCFLLGGISLLCITMMDRTERGEASMDLTEGEL